MENLCYCCWKKLKTLWQMLVLSNFFFCHYVFKRLSAAEASENPLLHTTNLWETILKISRQIYRTSINEDVITEIRWKQCCKLTNCLLWEISPFVTTFLKVVFSLLWYKKASVYAFCRICSRLIFKHCITQISYIHHQNIILKIILWPK